MIIVIVILSISPIFDFEPLATKTRDWPQASLNDGGLMGITALSSSQLKGNFWQSYPGSMPSRRKICSVEKWLKLGEITKDSVLAVNVFYPSSSVTRITEEAKTTIIDTVFDLEKQN